jgi:hypothetical protein
MTLRIIRPAWADDDLVAVAAKLSASNVTETVPLWVVGTPYVAGARVRRDTTHQIYEAGTVSTGKIPEDNLAGTPAPWLEVGATNRFAMFDAVNSTVTSNGTVIDVTLTGIRFDSLYLGGLDAASVDVTVMTGATVLYTHHADLLLDNVFSWSEWLNEDIIRDTDLVLSDLPGYAGATLRVQINQPGGTAQCGTLVVGRSRVLGEVQSGVQFRVKSNTTYKEDGFGGVKKKKRPAARRVSCQVFVNNALVDEVDRFMVDYDGDTLLWSMSEKYRTLNVLGDKEDFDMTVQNSDGSFYNLQVRGVV